MVGRKNQRPYAWHFLLAAVRQFSVFRVESVWVALFASRPLAARTFIDDAGVKGNLNALQMGFFQIQLIPQVYDYASFLPFDINHEQ